MRRLLVLGPQEIQSGIFKGVDKAAVPLWQEGMNVAFKRLGVEKIRGAKERATATSPVRDIVQAFVAGEKRAYLGTHAGVEMVTQSAVGAWARSTLGTWATAAQYADLETWGSWLLATNDVNPVSVWKNGVWGPLGGTTFTRARVLKRKTPFVFAMNTSNGETRIEWSSDSDPELWTPGPTNKARNYTLRDLDSEILAAEDLGDRLTVWSRNTMAIGQFVGGNNVFGWRRAILGIGAVSRRSVVTVDPYNYGLTRSGIFKTDGMSFTYVDDPAMLTWLLDNADWDQQHFFWGFHDQVLQCITWHFIDGAGAWNAISYFYEQNLLTRGAQMPLTAGAERAVFSHPIVVSDGLKFGTWAEDTTHFGTALPFSLKTKPLDFADRSRMKLLQLVRVDGTWTEPDVKLSVYALDHPEAEEQLIYDDLLRRINYLDYEAPYFVLEFSGTGSASITGIEFMGEPGGINF